MPAIKIGAASRIADSAGTHNPGEVVEYPTPALTDLADRKVIDPETGAPYVEYVGVPPAAPAPEPPKGAD